MTFASGPSHSAAAQQKQQGRALATRGQLPQAEACFRAVIRLAPSDPEGPNDLGIVLREQGRLDESLASFAQAIQLHPAYAEAWYNMGNALRDQKRLEDAAAAFGRAMELRPDLVHAHVGFGAVLCDLKRYAEAVDVYRNLIRRHPDVAMAHSNLAAVLRETGELAEALRCADQAIRLAPGYARAHINRGVILREQGRLADAVAALATATRLAPQSPEPFYHVAPALRDLGRMDDAVAAARHAIELKPDYAEAHCALASLYQHQEQADQAVASCRRAIALRPDMAEAHDCLANALKDQGLMDEAVASFRHAIELKPDDARLHSNLCFSINFHPGYAPEQILQENRRWAQKFQQPLLAAGSARYANDPAPERRLRIGYVSPDFRRHPAASFMLPLLSAHDPAQVQVYCYSNVLNPDAITDQCRSKSHVWRDVAHVADADLAQVVRDDRIDILIDLTLHMARNRLLTFARRPAPLQVTWLGYPGTTGLSAIDYRLSDPYLDPPDQRGSFYSERTIRLPETFWCYTPLAQTPPPNPLPALTRGHITFACFNHIAKVTPPALDLWSRTLAAIPQSRMIILCPSQTCRTRICQIFQNAGVDPSRLEFVSRLAAETYFATFGRVDLCLDPIPYPGHTTTLDALWMGVPAVTLCGRTAVSRGGLSILSNVGLQGFVACDEAQYIQIAQHYASDLPALAAIRARLRTDMLASPLTDSPRFARHLEAIYRQIWTEWCSTAS